MALTQGDFRKVCVSVSKRFAHNRTVGRIVSLPGK